MGNDLLKNVICIEGMKGAGKSTTIQGLRNSLAQWEVDVEIIAPFAQANNHFEAQGGLFPLLQDKNSCQNAFNYVLTIYRKELESSVPQGSLRLLDRGWMTLLCALEDSILPEGQKDLLQEMIVKTIPSTIFLHASPELTQQRRKDELDQKSGLSSQNLIEHDYTRRLALRNHHRESIVFNFDSTQHCLETRVNTIVDFVLSKSSSRNPFPEPHQVSDLYTTSNE